MDVILQPGRLLAFKLDHLTDVKGAHASAPESERRQETAERPRDDTRTPPPRTAPSLASLAYLVRSRDSHERQASQRRGQLHHVRVVAARTARLASIARSVQRTLAECIRAEDKQSFAKLHNIFQDALEDCTRGARSPKSDTYHADPSTFLEQLPESTRKLLLEFVTALRYDGDFIADRLACLSHRELLSLLPGKPSVRSSESIFGPTSGMRSHLSTHLGYAADAQADLVTSSGFQSMLGSMMLSVQCLSEGISNEKSRILDVWSTACARLIASQQPGSEKVVPAVLEIWSSSCQWPGKDRLGQWILETLRGGSFLLEQPSKQSFKLRIQGRPDPPAEDELRIEDFYAQAADDLLDLLADSQGTSIIPDSVLEMSRAIWTKLQSSSSHQRAFPHFVLTRWLFSPFLLEAVFLPEAYGIASDVYISETARHRMLREVVSRAQKAVFDVAYSWKHGNHVNLQTVRRVHAIMSRFGRAIDVPIARRRKSDCDVVMSASEIVDLMRTLYPQGRPASLSSDFDTVHSGVRSSASSVSGLSMFQNSASLPTPTQLPPLWHEEARAAGNERNGQSIVPDVEQSMSRAESAWFDPHQIRDAYNAIKEQLALGILDDQWIALPVGRGTLDHISASTSVSREDVSVHSELADECVAMIQALITSFEEAGDVDPKVSVDVSFERLMRAAEERKLGAERLSNFLDAHRWQHRLRAIKQLGSRSPGLETLAAALGAVESEARRSIRDSVSTVEACDRGLRSLQPCMDAEIASLKEFGATLEQSRDLMWFVADVRTSALYDEARCVMGALRIMGKSKRAQRTTVPPPLRHWNASKLNTNFHPKTEAQILDLMSALPRQGGPNKLSDDQATTTLAWMERNNVENLCKGEERLHRLGMEIRKCVEQATATDSALLVSNALFRCTSTAHAGTEYSRPTAPLAALKATAGRLDRLSLRTDVAKSLSSVSSTSHALSSTSSRDVFDSRSPTLTHKSSAPFWSPAVTEAESPSSATSTGSYQTYTGPSYRTEKKQSAVAGTSNQSGLDRLRRNLTSLLLSDLTCVLFADGSETDRALWTGLGGDLVSKHLCNVHGSMGVTSDTNDAARDGNHDFDYATAFRRLLRSFSSSTAPATKLNILYDISQLLSFQLTEQSQEPRSSPDPHILSLHKPLIAQKLPKEDQLVAGFRRLFGNAHLRPPFIFRDLQSIATLTPTHILESDPQGKAFWNAAVAITQLKQDACKLMVETADSIIAYHSNNRGHGRRSPSHAQQQRDSATFTTTSTTTTNNPSGASASSSSSPTSQNISHYSIADAGTLLQITAKFGDAVAQRELATLYLTNPDLMDHVLAPFALPGEVFKEELERKWRGDMHPSRCDPGTMCVALHWMKESWRGGDALAREFLRQREEMERLG